MASLSTRFKTGLSVGLNYQTLVLEVAWHGFIVDFKTT